MRSTPVIDVVTREDDVVIGVVGSYSMVLCRVFVLAIDLRVTRGR